MYKVIGATKTRAMRVMWMLEELGQPYDHLPCAPRSDEAKQYNPSGKIPALVDGDDVLTDSVAIMQYLADKHGALTAPWHRGPCASGCVDLLADRRNGCDPLGCGETQLCFPAGTARPRDQG